MKRFIVVACLAVVSLTAGQASAGFTTFTKNPFSSELGLTEVLDQLYTSKNITYSQLQDFGSPGTLTDNVWKNVSGGSAKAKAKYAGNSQKLDYVGEKNGEITLFDYKGPSGFINGGLGIAALHDFPTIDLPEFFRFRLQSPSTSGPFFSSDRTLNTNGKDHMVSFLLSNGNYVIAFEDRGAGSDNDYNDLVVEVELITPQGGPAFVPEPATMALWGIGVFGMGLVVRRKKNLTATV